MLADITVLSPIDWLASSSTVVAVGTAVLGLVVTSISFWRGRRVMEDTFDVELWRHRVEVLRDSQQLSSLEEEPKNPDLFPMEDGRRKESVLERRRRLAAEAAARGQLSSDEAQKAIDAIIKEEGARKETPAEERLRLIRELRHLLEGEAAPSAPTTQPGPSE